jgi:hypothetical protein
MKPQVAVQLTTDTAVHEEYCRLTPTVLGHRPVDLLRVATVSAVPAATTMLSLIAILVAEVATAGAPRTGLVGELGAEATTAAEATRTATPPVFHTAASMPAKKLKNYDVIGPPWHATTTASPPSLLGFATYSSQKKSNL